MLLASSRDCAVAPPGSWTALAVSLVGEDWDRLESAHATVLRSPIARALAGVRTTPTKRNPDGVSRGALIRACGRHYATMRGVDIGVEPRQCRQRPCPACARARARDNAADLEAAMRTRAGVPFLFATLTQRKLSARDEDARGAVERLYAAWRRVANSRSTRDDFRSMFEGGLRSVETTWSPMGSNREHGGVVEYDGFHAHLHVMLEVREGVEPALAAAWLVGAWCDASEGASVGAQVVRRARFEDAHQLAKYITKPLEENSGDAGIVRALFAGLHGLRLLQAFGSWVARDGRPGWRVKRGDIGPRLVPRRGPEFGELLRVVSRPIEGSTGRVAFTAPDGADVVWVDANEAWSAVEAAFRRRVASRGPPG